MNNFSLKVSKQMRDTFIFSQFAKDVYNVLNKNFPQTYFVGGTVRNALLGAKISDIDIATNATPAQVAKVFKENKIKFSDAHSKFGVIVAGNGKRKIEITTFRKDSYNHSRYPEITFVKSAKTDSIRRDFTINALYWAPGKGELLDFHGGIKDVKRKRLVFIGNAKRRIEEDPLRIVRAYRFMFQYSLKMDNNTNNILKNNLHLLKNISATRIKREINLVASKNLRAKLKKVIHN